MTPLQGLNRILTIIIAAVLLAAGSSCSLTKSKSVAEAAVGHFHDQFNAGQFREIYSQTDDGFKKGANEEEFVSVLEAVRRKLGTVQHSNQAGWGVNATPSGTMASLTYEVEFSEGKGTEKFVFYVSGDRATLYHYTINSPLLITK
jgi:hypothetical protein